jgi:1-acyl-sn-glycerol-3-phosphate acyltransferase
MYLHGVLSVKKQRVYLDYSKWLGPDYSEKIKKDPEAAFQGATCFVANHQSFADINIMLSLCTPKPGFIAKSVVRSVFAVGYVADVILKSLFVKRADSKSKYDVLTQL